MSTLKRTRTVKNNPIKYLESSDSENELDSPKKSKKTAAKPKPAKKKKEKNESLVILSDESDSEKPLKRKKAENPKKKNVKTKEVAGTSKKENDQTEDVADGNVLKPIKSTKRKQNEENLEAKPSKKIKPSVLETEDEKKPWSTTQLLSELENIDPTISENIVKLFQEDNTIPFISRYRKELTGHLEPEKLRDIKQSYEYILNLQSKAETIVKSIDKENLLTPELKFQISAAKTLEELELLYAPFKPSSKGSLFERAKKLGLEPIAENILNGTDFMAVESLVKPNTEGLENSEKVCEGIKNIMSHLITKNTEVLTEVRRLKSQYKITLSSNQVKAKKDEKDVKKEVHKFENYFDFSMPTSYMKPHQILAINRGENLKILSVKLQIDDRVKRDLKFFVQKLFLYKGKRYQFRQDLFEESFNDAYSKKISPLMQRQERADLTKKAEKASVEVFANNLKQLLLLSPNRERILGIDPGFSNGCKIALISENGDILDTAVFYLHNSKSEKQKHYGDQLNALLRKHNINLIALGNGTACRETESWITNLFEQNILSKTVRYCIVNEQGASIYSCSDLAKKEFPNMDVNLISAVSIARRLFDPISEYVKIDSKHLGVGMYQHDINEKILNSTLDEVVVECVSFVGVDVNSTSESLLSRVAGLSQKRAEAIIQHRIKNGPFKSREDVLKVKGIGKVAFKNCAGFLRIDPQTAGIKSYNLLDSTWIHPESYQLAEKIIKYLELNRMDIGKSFFIQKIKERSAESEALAKKYKEPKETIELIFSALQREIAQDYRLDIDNKPLFKQGLTQLSDLKVGTTLSGAVTNITDFGAFVDIGVKMNGLIHRSKMNGMILKINDRVEVKIVSLEIEKNRIGLFLEKIL